METFNVLFPLNLKPLTYKCPEHLREKAVPGMLVSAPLKNQITMGIILSKSSNAPRHAPTALRSVSDIHGDSPLLEEPLLNLLDWMSDYYFASKGLVFKNMLPQEAFKRTKARKSINPQLPPFSKEGMEGFLDKNILAKIRESAEKKEYKTFLLHIPSSTYEIASLRGILQSRQNTIILVPEIVRINNIASVIKEITGEKLCILHSGLSKSRRSDAYEKIISGKCNIILGTRMSVFAPLKNVSLIAVMQEHSSSYKTEEGLRYNARDVAVMRAYLEKATVVLSSISPSIESIYNAKLGKYSLLKPDAVIQRPRIKVISMYRDKQPSPNLTKTVIDAVKSSINKNEKAMFVINRKGYSMLTCKECGCTETCDKCGIPLIFHMDDKSLRCHYCGAKSPAPEKCKKCGSFDIELAGAGIQRIEENLKKIFNLEPVRLDSDRIKRKAKTEELSEIIAGEAVIIGTKLLTRRLQKSENFGVAAVLNADIYLNLPDFRSAEKAYQEFAGIADKLKPDGTLFIQTRIPQNYLFKFLKTNDYYGFCTEELSRRRAMLYPPFSKIALITLKGRDYGDDKVKNFIKKNSDKDLEIFGPSPSSNRKGQTEYTILLKSALKRKLHSSVKEFLKMCGGYKNLEINVAIDP